ncbi:phage minor capsid protein [uncultured Ruminococcus sp.]|uniref:phage minor capsid protein n=1 Tax=uncultured Ruminococcus sp. TaxID=165186 RepID=UPI0025D4457F|nr:phage minor capsid protein [uncultured Ruminococcus sp.]
MLTPDQLAHCADDILKLYSQLEEEIVRDVARRISKTGIITETGKLQLNAMQELGTLNSDILKSLSKYTDKTEEQLQKLFEDAAVTATEYDNEIYRANGLNPKSIKVSAAQMQTLEAGYKKTSGNLSNLTRTTAVTSQTGFINACTLAEMKAESGAFSPQQAIVDAIKQVASEGAFVLYPSGHRDRLDVAVRRNVMTGIGQTTGEICLANARELDCDLMEITAHAGARPSHASWQGQIVSLSGRKGYLSLSDIGYGTGDGFKGWNCRHDWFPYFEGSTRMYSEKDLEELDAENIEFPDGSMHTLYEAEQYQRALERKIRETKRILAAQDEFFNNTSSESMKRAIKNNFDNFSIKLKRQEAQMNAFFEKTGLLVDNARVQKYGFGRSTAQKAVSSANKHYKTWSSEHNINNIKTLAEYYKVKYNDSERYALLQGYVKAVDKGDISPLIGFDLYESKAKEIKDELVGLKINNELNYEITDFSTHFIDRVLGQTSTSHEGMRLSTTIEQLKDSIANPLKTSEPFFVNTKKNGEEYLDERINITGKSCSFVYSIKDKLLVQATSFGEDIIL